MKAKDCVRLYSKSANKELTILKLADDFANEAREAIEMKSRLCPHAVKCVLLELDSRWAEFARSVKDGSVKKTGFRDLYRFRHKDLCKKIGF